MADYNKVNAVATLMISFSGVLGVWAAIVYYLYQIKISVGLIDAMLWVTIYIDLNLLYLYILKMAGILK